MKSKILFILHLPPPVHGASMMGSFIKESKLINSKFDTTYINLAIATTLDQSRKLNSNKFSSFIKLLLKVFESVRKTKYDLCYITLNAAGPAFYKDFLVVIILKLFRENIIYHFHNKGVDINRKGIINSFLYRFAFHNTRTILLSPNLYKDIKFFVKNENVYYLPNAIPYNNEVNCSEVKVTDLELPCRLLFLSNMMMEKGVFVLIEACKILKERKLNFLCDFVGAWADVTEDDFNKQISKYKLADLITSHGKKYGDEKVCFLKRSDIFVFPTYYHNETFGLVILEAMQVGLPVVSTLEGAIGDVVLNGVTGFLVAQRSVEVLAEKLEVLIQNPNLRKSMGLAGKERYQALFTIQKFEQKAVDIFTDAIQVKTEKRNKFNLSKVYRF